MHRATLSVSSSAESITTRTWRSASSSLMPPEHLVAVHLGHHHVEEHEVEPARREQVERFPPARRGDDEVALPLEVASEHVAV